MECQKKRASVKNFLFKRFYTCLIINDIRNEEKKSLKKKKKSWGKVIQRIEISSNFALGFKSN